MLSISEIVAKTEKMFDLFNAHFYAGELARPAITVSPDGGRGAYGWCTVYEIWQANGQAYREMMTLGLVMRLLRFQFREWSRWG